MEHKKVTEDFNKRVWRDEEDPDSTAEMRTPFLQGENRRLPFFYVELQWAKAGTHLCLHRDEYMTLEPVMI